MITNNQNKCEITYEKEPEDWSTFKSDTKNLTSKHASDLKISTMTTIYRLRDKLGEECDFNLVNIWDNIEYSKKACDMCVELSMGSNKNKDKDNSGKFYNQITFGIVYKDCNISAKIFKNGKLQATGSRNIDIVREVPILVGEILNEIPGATKNLIQKILVDPENEGVVMINSNFKFPSEIRQNIIKDIIIKNYLLRDGGNFLSAVAPNRYPGLNIKFLTTDSIEKYSNDTTLNKVKGGKVSILLFRSGSIIITGTTKVAYLKEAYETIIDIIVKHLEEIKVN